jgi:hypothetical protein
MSDQWFALASRDKARPAYQDFLTLWKHTDPDLGALSAVTRCRTSYGRQSQQFPNERWRDIVVTLGINGSLEISGDYYISALPAEALAMLLNDDMDRAFHRQSR